MLMKRSVVGGSGDAAILVGLTSKKQKTKALLIFTNSKRALKISKKRSVTDSKWV